MHSDPLLVCLPIADRPTAHRFYTEGLGLEAVGEPADDGVPEPLTLRVNAGVSLMLIPTGGFGWVVGDSRTVAPAGTTEVLLALTADDEAGVRAVVDRAVAAGAALVSAPQQQPWGFSAVVADPDGHLWQVSDTAS